MVWYSYLFQNFSQFVGIYTVKAFHIVNEADVYLEFPCFLYDPVNTGNLISGSSAFCKSSIVQLEVPGSCTAEVLFEGI